MCTHPRQRGMLQPGFERRAFPTTAAKSQSQKLTLLSPIPQTFFLLQCRSTSKSVLVYGSPAKLESVAEFNFDLPEQSAPKFSGRQQQWEKFDFACAEMKRNTPPHNTK
jgi:hypothetical protein